MVAVDDEFTSLLAAGNAVPDGKDGAEAVSDAASLGVPVPPGGLMAVEMDGGNVPSAFKAFGDHVQVGDRIACWGRWIVDTGHAVDLPATTMRFDPATIEAATAGASLQAETAVPLMRHDGPLGGAGGGLHTNGGGGGGGVEGGGGGGTPPPAPTSYRAEVHPPLLMAIGGTRPDGHGGVITRILLTSRPYLSAQVYTTDTDTLYDDHSGDDGTFLDHLNNEVDKLHGLIPSSTLVEAHPKVKSKPFDGTHLFRITVQPPPPTPPAATTGDATTTTQAAGFAMPSGLGRLEPHAAAGADAAASAPGAPVAAEPTVVAKGVPDLSGAVAGGVLAGPEEVQVRFQLTHRTGIAVQVSGTGDSVDVWVAMNSNQYVAPPLPARHGERWDKDRLDALEPGGGDLLTFEEVISLLGLFQPGGVLTVPLVEYFVSRGVETDLYAPVDIDVLDASHAVGWQRASSVPAGVGIVADDGQPFPVVGFIELRRARPLVISAQAGEVGTAHIETSLDPTGGQP